MSTVCEGGNSGGSPGVGIMDGNGLILVLIIVDNTFQQYIKWPTKKYVVHGVVNDMELDVECDFSEEHRDILCETQCLVYLAVRRLHAKPELCVVCQAKCMQASSDMDITCEPGSRIDSTQRL